MDKLNDKLINVKKKIVFFVGYKIELRQDNNLIYLENRKLKIK